MYRNTIALRQALDVQQYQMAVKALADIGIEVAEPDDTFDDFYYELSKEDLNSIAISREQLRMGLGIKNEDVFKEIEQRRKERWK